MRQLIYIEERTLYAEGLICILKRSHLFNKIFLVGKLSLLNKLLKNRIDKNDEVFILIGKVSCNLVALVKKLRYLFSKVRILLICEPSNGFGYDKLKDHLSMFDGIISVEWKLSQLIKAVNYFIKEGVVVPKRLFLNLFCCFKDKLDYNNFNLTEQETKILKLICNGKINKEIAKLLNIKEKTVKNHINKIYTKLGVKRRAEAIYKASMHGVV